MGKEWRGATENSPLAHGFDDACHSNFPLGKVKYTASHGDALIAHYGALRKALRAVQERKMAEQEHLVKNAEIHLARNPELRDDVTELHRLGAIPRFRGPTPDECRVRGLPRNKSDRDFTTQKLWSYIQEEKCSFVRREVW